MDRAQEASSAPITPREDGWEPNGCTGVPEFYRDCCIQHDIDYHDKVISRAEADARFRRCIQEHSPFGKASPMALWRWAGVRLFGRFLYNKRAK